jgi:hypothetical protein
MGKREKSVSEGGREEGRERGRGKKKDSIKTNSC